MVRKMSDVVQLESAMGQRTQERKDLVVAWDPVVVADEEFSVRPTDAVKENAEMKDRELFSQSPASPGLVYEHEVLSGSERRLVEFSSKTYDEDHTDGDRVTHIAKDRYLAISGSFNMVVEGGNLQKVKGVLKIDVDDELVLKRGDSTIKISADGQSVDIESPTVTVTAQTATVTGGSLNVAGSSSADMSGPFNCISVCPLTGAPHRGGVVSGT